MLFDHKYIVEVIKMARVIMAEVHIRDSCDPSNPGDCAPEIRLSGAAELENLASEFGIVFEEAAEDTRKGSRLRIKVKDSKLISVEQAR